MLSFFLQKLNVKYFFPFSFSSIFRLRSKMGRRGLCHGTWIHIFSSHHWFIYVCFRTFFTRGWSWRSRCYVIISRVFNAFLKNTIKILFVEQIGWKNRWKPFVGNKKHQWVFILNHLCSCPRTLITKLPHFFASPWVHRPQHLALSSFWMKHLPLLHSQSEVDGIFGSLIVYGFSWFIRNNRPPGWQKIGYIPLGTTNRPPSKIYTWLLMVEGFQAMVNR